MPGGRPRKMATPYSPASGEFMEAVDHRSAVQMSEDMGAPDVDLDRPQRAAPRTQSAPQRPQQRMVPVADAGERRRAMIIEMHPELALYDPAALDYMISAEEFSPLNVDLSSDLDWTYYWVRVKDTSRTDGVDSRNVAAQTTGPYGYEMVRFNSLPRQLQTRFAPFQMSGKLGGGDSSGDNYIDFHDLRLCRTTRVIGNTKRLANIYRGREQRESVRQDAVNERLASTAGYDGKYGYMKVTEREGSSLIEELERQVD